MSTIVPAILAHDEATFREKLFHPAIRERASLFQIDILDGSLYAQTSWADPEVIGAWNNLPELELHFMVADPLPLIKRWVQYLPTIKRMIVHAELQTSLPSLLEEIQLLGSETGIALNPETSADSVSSLLAETNLALVMGVHPGKSGQAFLGETVLQKIQSIHTQFPELIIGVDGGITMQNIDEIHASGAQELCVSSSIWSAQDPGNAWDMLHEHLI